MTFWENEDLMDNTIGEGSNFSAQSSRNASEGKHTLGFKIQPLPLKKRGSCVV